MKVWFRSSDNGNPITMQRGKPSPWLIRKYNCFEQDISEFTDVLKFVQYTLIRTGLETTWMSRSTGILYKMTTNESIVALCHSKNDILSGKFNVRKKGAWCTLYYIVEE